MKKSSHFGIVSDKMPQMLARRGPDPPLSAGALLGGISAAYGGAMALRAEAYRRGGLRSRRLPLPTVSVGNLTTGGTGKTPMIVYLARRLTAAGLRPVVVSRGYRGEAERRGGIVSDREGIRLSSRAAGDEPWMIAQLLPGVPVVVGRSRYRAGRSALEAFAPDVLLLDDGFQHLQLQRDVDLLLLDAAAPFGNGRIFPRGMLREPISALRRADAVVLTRSEDPDAPVPPELAACRAAVGKPLLRAVHAARLRGIFPPGKGRPQQTASADAKDLEGIPAAAFSGIARNDDVRRSIRDLGGDLVAFFGFGDHHRYRIEEIRGLFRAAVRAGARLMVTTEKDFARLGGDNPFDMDLAVIGVDIEIVSGKERLVALLSRGGLQRCGGRPGPVDHAGAGTGSDRPPAADLRGKSR